MVAIYGYHRRLQLTAQILLIIFTAVQIVLLVQYGTWVKKKKDMPTLIQIADAKKKSLNYQFLTGYGLASPVVIRHAQRSFLEPSLGRIYRRYRIAKSNEMAYGLMQKDRSAEQVTIEQYSPGLRQPAKKISGKEAVNRTTLTYSSFNRLVFDVQSAETAFFSLAYPYTGHWQAYVNDQKVRVYRANGAYHAVEVPAGISQVEFRYTSPAAFWGMVISCATLTIIGFSIGVLILKNPAGFAVFVVAFFLGAGGFGLWFQSLYSGVNLNTEYHWKERPSAPFPNLAYGKRTYMSSLIYPNYVYHRNSGRAVDGLRAPSSGFISGLDTRPWWIVDLHQPKSFKQIVIYEGRNTPKFNSRPLTVAVSNKGENWKTVKTITDAHQEKPLRIHFSPPQTARYVMIRASGVCYLSFDEVEIYPAKKNISTPNNAAG
jgi:hypothetical protein